MFITDMTGDMQRLLGVNAPACENNVVVTYAVLVICAARGFCGLVHTTGLTRPLAFILLILAHGTGGTLRGHVVVIRASCALYCKQWTHKHKDILCSRLQMS